MEALDTNEDGELSKEEIANAIKSLTALDKDRDGKLSQEESGLESKKDLQRSGPPQGGPGGPGGPPQGGKGKPPQGGQRPARR